MALSSELLAALVASLIGVVQLYLRRAQRREIGEGDRLPAAMRRQHSIENTLQDLCGKVGGARAMLLACHNGGARPKPGGQYYVSCRAEFADTPHIERQRSSFQKVPIYDPAYLNLIVRLQEENFLTFQTEDLPEDSWLRGVYAADEVKSSAVAEVVRKSDEYFYLAIQFVDEVEEFSPATRGHIQATAGRIRHFLRDLNDPNTAPPVPGSGESAH